jgi:hypothetical protein
MNGKWYHQELVAMVLGLACFYGAVLIPAFELMIGFGFFGLVSAMIRHEREQS